MSRMLLGDAASAALDAGGNDKNGNDHALAVYHALPQQMFERLQSSSAGIRQWHAATEVRLENVAASGRLCIGFIKDRFSVGSVFSVPDEIKTSVRSIISTKSSQSRITCKFTSDTKTSAVESKQNSLIIVKPNN